MYNSFTDADQLTLLTNPGVFSYRPYGSSDAFTKAIFANGSAYNKAVESVPVQFDDAGDVTDIVSRETVEISMSSGRVLDLDFLTAISGGLYKITETPGDPVSGSSYQVLATKWEYNKFILLPGQNASKEKQTIDSVTGSVDSALTVAVDYDQVFFPEVGWGIMIKDSTTVTTLSQAITVVYAYTPSALKTMSTGGGKLIQPLEIKFETYTSDNKLVTYEFYRCFPSGNLGHGFAAENNAEPATIDFSFTAKADTSRLGELDSLYNISIEA